MSDEKEKEEPLDKWEGRDLGPKEFGAMMGSAIGNYVAHGMSREEILELVGDLYDEILGMMADLVSKVPKH